MDYMILKEFLVEFIIGIFSIFIIGLTTYGVMNIGTILAKIVTPLFDVFRKETKDKLTPMESKFDVICEALAVLLEDKANSPITSEYKKEQYLDLSNRLIITKNINITKNVVDTIDKVEDVLDKVVDNVESFLDRNKV